MWEGPDGQPRFRWDTQGPLTIHKPRRPFTAPLQIAERSMEDFRPLMIKTIQDSLIKEFESV
jgi:hypothetical protein